MNEIVEFTRQTNQTDVRWLIAAAVLIIAWQVPFGRFLLYPFTILATWFHEICHGLMATLLGGRFDRLKLYANGSGAAFYSLDVAVGRLGRALVAAAGPLGPPVAGGILLVASRRFEAAHWLLIAMGLLLILSALFYVRTLFGLIAISL